jgi:putative ATP-dependent endonuclease of OLD family
MHIDWINLKGFRNFESARLSLRESTLIIGANDVGKTNLLYALRLLLDRSLPESALDPAESDFHITLPSGKQADSLEVVIKFVEVDKDAVLASLKGAVSDSAETFVSYRADRANLIGRFYIGPTRELMEEISGRYYLRFMNLRYVQSQRDLAGFVQSEKKHLLRLSKDARTKDAANEDETLLLTIGRELDAVNTNVRKLHYVETATAAINRELHELSHHHGNYEVRLETGAIHTAQFIDQLELAGTSGGSRVGLGGDGRNNQILMALWKAKSEREQDSDNECIIYCIEEPEAHLHPQQQRKLAEYLIERLCGQVLVTTHSPQITAKFQPDAIVRLVAKAGASTAANKGCSKCVEEAWTQMSYRMSILPAEAFFADLVFLVEGASEVLLYHELARQLGIDLDRFNISILAVDGIDFNAYVCILDAMEIPWVARTDNDVFSVPNSDPPRRRLAGLNRARGLIGETAYENVGEEFGNGDLVNNWTETSIRTNPRGVFVSQIDLERDLVQALPAECMALAGVSTEQDAIKYLQRRKAIHMGEFLRQNKAALKALAGSDLAKPLEFAVKAVTKS